MSGEMIDFSTDGSPARGYLATPASGTGPGVVVLHAWWGLTAPFRQTCDRLAEAGYVALAPDLYRGKTAATVEEAKALGQALDSEVERVRADIAGAIECAQHHGAAPSGSDGKVALLGFSLGGAYALDASVNQPDNVAAVTIFYATYPGIDYRASQASYLFHLAENDPYEPAESVVAMEHDLHAAGRPATFYTYPGATHWFFETNQVDAYNPQAAALAEERTFAFLNTHLHTAA